MRSLFDGWHGLNASFISRLWDSFREMRSGTLNLCVFIANEDSVAFERIEYRGGFWQEIQLQCFIDFSST
jgi:hypothetical protein